MRPILDIPPGPLGRGPILHSEARRTEIEGLRGDVSLFHDLKSFSESQAYDLLKIPASKTMARWKGRQA